MRRVAAVALATASFVCAPGARPARAQTAAAGPGRFEASGGPMWIGSQALGSATATETTPAGGALNLFSTSSELTKTSGFEGRIAFRLLPSLEIDAQGSYGAPAVEIAIRGDSEGAVDTTVSETVQQFTIGGGAAWYPVSAFGGRLAPFVTGGFGQLRQMHEDRIELETGRYLQIGGGVKYFIVSRPNGFFNAFGVRLDVRALVRSEGVAFDDDGHASPSVGVSAFVRF